MRKINHPRSSVEGTLDENLEATVEWLEGNGLTRIGRDFRLSLDTDNGLTTQAEPAVSGPLQRAKKRTREEAQAICEKWKPKSGNEAPILKDDQWAALKDKQGGLFLDLKRLPADAIAFYRPFHIKPFEAWGIYVLVDRLLRYGQGVRLQLPILEDLYENVFLHLVLFEMFRHEFFHHPVESAARANEILASAPGTPIPSYLDYREKTWAGAFGRHPHQPL